LLAKRLVELRNEKKLSQTELAKKLGIARTTLSGYELETREPDLKTIQKIASLFDVSVDYLIGITDEKKPVETKGKTETEIQEWIHNPEIRPTWKGRELSDEELVRLNRVLEAVLEDVKSNED
jgi:transcriptional regulator with XRE-family HTH domain